MAFAIVSACGWLREIAYQFSVLNQGAHSEGGKMFHFHINGVGREEIQALAAKIDQLAGRVEIVIEKENRIMATEAQLQSKIDIINTNTTASAAAATALAKLLEDLKASIKDGGLSAAKEDEILAKLTAAADTSTALKTFLEATASSSTEPTPVQPPVIPVP